MKRYVLFFVGLMACICNIRVDALGAGALDPSFGTNSSGVFNCSGTVRTDFTAAIDSVDAARGVALQLDGKIVAVGNAGSSNNLMAIARYNTDGTLDTSFGSGGQFTTGFSGAVTFGSSVAIQSDGKIVVVGFTDAGASSRNWAIIRLNTDGTLDTTFNPGGALGDIPNVAGKLNLDIAAGVGFDQANDVAIQPDGKIVIVGLLDGGLEAGVVRLNPDGSFDTTFNAGGALGSAPNIAGVLALSFGTFADASGVVLFADGSMLVSGFRESGGVRDYLLFKLTTFGTFDTTFGASGAGIFDGSGTVFTDLGGTGDEANGLVVRPDGRIIAVGRSDASGSPEFGLAGYNSNGTPDITFGTNGSGVFDGSATVLTNFAGFDDEASRVALQSDGKIVVAGRLFVGGNINRGVAIARYNPDGTLDTSFSGNGKNTETSAFAMSFGQVGLVVQPNDRAVVASVSDISGGSNQEFFLARYTTVAVTDPVANDDSFTLCTDAQNVFLPVLANDVPGSDPNLEVFSVTAPGAGTASVASGGQGVIYSTPGGGVMGGTAFSYTVKDSNGASDTATVIVSYNDTADPNAIDDTFTICATNSKNHLHVVSNDVSGCDNSLKITAFTQGTKGTVTQVSPKVLNYAPNGTKGSDSFTYTIEDGNGNTDTATVNITVV